mgnify:CR=1 FL=1
MKKRAYWKYLKSEHWQTMRRLALERAEGQCAICGASERVEVHHRDYSRLGEERLADLTVLCDPCHELYHTSGEVIDEVSAGESPVPAPSAMPTSRDWQDVAAADAKLQLRHLIHRSLRAGVPITSATIVRKITPSIRKWFEMSKPDIWAWVLVWAAEQGIRDAVRDERMRPFKSSPDVLRSMCRLTALNRVRSRLVGMRLCSESAPTEEAIWRELGELPIGQNQTEPPRA